MSILNCVDQVQSALRATEIHHPWSWSWFWEKETLLPLSLRRVLSPRAVTAYLIHTLQKRLYSHFYCKGFAVPAGRQTSSPSLASSRAAFITGLSMANKGTGYIEGEWEVFARKETLFLIRRNGLRFAANEDELFVHGQGPIEIGMTVYRRMPKELRFLSPGFFMAMGDELLASGDHTSLVRFYWNLRPEGAAKLMEAITTTFNEARLPFRLKVLSDPNQFTRCDAGVLYIAKRDYGRVREILEAIYSELRPHLKRETPVFTKRLAVGLGIAESPAQGASFGEHRCRILAEGIVRAFESGGTSLNGRFAIVRDYFADSGISLERPFLNLGSDDVFDFASGTTARGPVTAGDVSDVGATRDMLLQAALEIGEIVTETAVWHEQRCNWLGLGVYGKGRHHEDSSKLVYQALGPEMYAGTSGVSLFLAELHATTGHAAVRRAAIGAIRQATAAARSQSRSLGLGLYDGVLGIALIAAYVGRLLHEDELLRDAAQMVQGVQRQKPDARCADLISGNAGAIVALLALRDLLDDATLADLAVRLAEELRQMVDRKGGCYSWKSVSLPKQRNLLGLSHGTAGVGYALLEVYRATGDPDWRELAAGAFRYERQWYDEQAGNWPDFRGVPARAGTKGYPVDLPFFWCHGAAGIALSRLHAHRTLHDEWCRSEALTALTTTRRWTESMLAGEPFNFSLCHGLAGNADILAAGSRTLDDAFAGGTQLAMDVAAAGIRRHARRDHRWPFDVLGSRSPGLMTGLSGVGHFYLRLFDSGVPSVLLPEGDALLRRSTHGR